MLQGIEATGVNDSASADSSGQAGQDVASDEEIRQLITARRTPSTGAGMDLHGVVLEEVLGQGCVITYAALMQTHAPLADTPVLLEIVSYILPSHLLADRLAWCTGACGRACRWQSKFSHSMVSLGGGKQPALQMPCHYSFGSAAHCYLT